VSAPTFGPLHRLLDGFGERHPDPPARVAQHAHCPGCEAGSDCGKPEAQDAEHRAIRANPKPIIQSHPARESNIAGRMRKVAARLSRTHVIRVVSQGELRHVNVAGNGEVLLP
jgi:hypothetical protein